MTTIEPDAQALCPFCVEDLAPLHEGFQTLDFPVQCVRCMAAVLFTRNLDDPLHVERLTGALMEFLPPEGVACRPELRAMPYFVPAEGFGNSPLYLIAAWNLDEWVTAPTAARVLDLPVGDVERMLESGRLQGGRQEPASRVKYVRARWLAPRWALLRYLDEQRNL
jgi:hypothetical protein